MWYPRDPLPPNHGRYPPAMHPNQRPTFAPHTRRQSTTSFPVIPPLDTTNLYPYFQQPLQSPQRDFSLQAHSNYNSTQGIPYPYLPPVQHHHQQDAFQPQPLRRRSGMTHSFSAPWSGFGRSQSKPPTPKMQQKRNDRRGDVRPSMKDLVKISAPQDLDGDVFEDDYEGPRDDDTLGRVYAYQPTAYWAGRLSSLLDRFAAEYPDETRAWKITRALKSLNANAYGEGAKHSLDDFKEVFERKIKSGNEW